MTSNEFKKIARLLKRIYSELENEAIESGVDITSPEFDEVIEKARLELLDKYGFSLDEYNEAKSEVNESRARNSNAIKELTERVEKLEELIKEPK